MDGPASRRKFVFGIVLFGASRWPPQIVIRYVAEGTTQMAARLTSKTIGITTGFTVLVMIIIAFPIAVHFGYAAPLGVGDDYSRGQSLGTGAAIFSAVVGFVSYGIARLLGR